ncbi:MAG: hypothetical protein ACM3S3_08900 [Candidatus Doudnabacteria bacterium]
MIKPMKKSLAAAARLSDDALATVSGAGVYVLSPITNVQSNFAGPVLQVAAANFGLTSQAVAVVQGNSATFA